VILLVEYLIIMVWLPSSTESFQSAHSIFNTFYNFTGSTDGLAWCVGVLFPAYFFTGYEAAAHVAEETQRADDRAGMLILTSVLMCFCKGLRCMHVSCMC
jgi:amino acid transporter